jgi:hypothetical protein
MRIEELIEHLTNVKNKYGNLVVTIGTDGNSISTSEVTNIDILNKHVVYLRNDEGLRHCCECLKYSSSRVDKSTIKDLYANDDIYSYVCEECLDREDSPYYKAGMIPVEFYI